jgi:hypothetical protein
MEAYAPEVLQSDADEPVLSLAVELDAQHFSLHCSHTEGLDHEPC